jgi:single-strand DNA-binding protein
MANFNKVILMGNMVQDPELKNIGTNGKVVDFTIAVNREWKGPEGQEGHEVSYIDCAAFNKKAEVIEKYFSKGRAIFVEGRLKQDTWEDKTTKEKRSKLRVVVENFHFIDSKKEAETVPAVAGNDGMISDESLEADAFDAI